MKTVNAAKKKGLGLGLIGFSFLFLANPNVNIIDVLPDFIGYWLLCLALCRLADLNESIGEAIASFRKMILIDAGKWLALFWVFGLSVTTERNSSLLLWTFVFAVLEWIILIPAYAKLFAGITEVGYFYPNTAIFGKEQNNHKKSPTDKIRNFTIFFVLFKSALCVLPEFADLSNSSYDESSAFLNIYRYIGTMRMLAFIPVLVIGVVWCVRAQRYFSSLRKDEPLMACLLEKYETQVVPKVGLFIRRNFRIAYILLILALVFTIDLRVDYQNIIPDVFAAILFFFVFAFLQKNTAMRKGSQFGIAGLYLLTTVASSAAEHLFFAEYYYGAIIKSEEAWLSYAILLICDIVKSVAFLLLLGRLLHALYAVIREHTGYVSGRENRDASEEQMISVLQKELRSSLIVAYITAIFYALSDLAFDLLAPNVGFMNLINLGFAVVCISFFIKAVSAIQHAVDTKYMLD